MTIPYDRRPEFAALDDAIRAMTATDVPDQLVTGWVVITSTLHTAESAEGEPDDESMRYLTPKAQGYHHTLGLLMDAYNVLINRGRVIEEGDR